MDELSAIIRISRFFGNDASMVQAGGGNTSVKVNGKMHIKASGIALRMVNERSFLFLDAGGVVDILLDGSISSMKEPEMEQSISKEIRRLSGNGFHARPSIEVFLHAVLGRKYVVHVHPVYANALTCLANGTEVAESLFNKGTLGYLWIPYRRPGYPLGKLLKAGIKGYESSKNSMPDIVFLQNHGIIISADDEDGLYRLSETLIGKLKDFFGDMPVVETGQAESGLSRIHLDMLRYAFKAVGASAVQFHIPSSPVINAVSQSEAAQSMFTRGSLYPDQIVYCGESPLYLNAVPDIGQLCMSLRKFVDRFGCLPKVVVYEGVGAALSGGTRGEVDAMQEVLDAHLKVAFLAEKKGELRFLPVEEASYIANWESERYRRAAMSKGSGVR